MLSDQPKELCVCEQIKTRKDSSVIPKDALDIVFNLLQVHLNFTQLFFNPSHQQLPDPHTSLCTLIGHRLGYLLVQPLCIFKEVIIRQFLDIQQPAILLYFHYFILHLQPIFKAILSSKQGIISDAVLFKGLRVWVGEEGSEVE